MIPDRKLRERAKRVIFKSLGPLAIKEEQATEVEEEIFSLHACLHAYKAKVRTICATLRRNKDVREAIICGTLVATQLCAAPACSLLTPLQVLRREVQVINCSLTVT